MTAPEPAVNEENPVRDAGVTGIRGALGRYRVLAYVVGVGLLALCFAMVMNYGFDQPRYSKIVGPVHGFLYVVYLVVTVDLALKLRWPAKRTILILLAGMVPFVSFVAERRVTREVQSTLV
jgi:integral membrane protein